MTRLIPALRFAVVLAALLAVAVVVSRWWLPVRVMGGSMHPTLHAGDLVIVRMGARPRVGDVALIAPSARGLVLHRVVARSPTGGFITRGDANPIPDRSVATPSQIRGVVRGALPVGVLVERWHRLRSSATLAVQRG